MVRLSRVESTCIGLYLAAIVAANYAVATFGQAALPITASLLVPFDLVTRDVLHEQWKGSRLWPKMLSLIFVGSVLSAALSLSVAVASFTAFCSAGVTNAVVYALMASSSRMARMNASNLAAATVDSIVFPVVAFDAVDPRLCMAQAASKFASGFVLSWIFVRYVHDHLH